MNIDFEKFNSGTTAAITAATVFVVGVVGMLAAWIFGFSVGWVAAIVFLVLILGLAFTVWIDLQEWPGISPITEFKNWRANRKQNKNPVGNENPVNFQNDFPVVNEIWVQPGQNVGSGQIIGKTSEGVNPIDHVHKQEFIDVDGTRLEFEESGEYN